MTRATKHARGFRLIIEPADTDKYGLRLEQTNGSDSTPPVHIATLKPYALDTVAEAVQLAVRDSNQSRTVLSAGRRMPIVLDESAGVRLALTLIAAEPVTKRSRREAILGGIAAMSSEETYYWFAKVTGPTAPRARRALRILLADDGRSGITA